MNQELRRKKLIAYLKSEDKQYSFFEFPSSQKEQISYLRTFLSIRQSKPISPLFIWTQDRYLKKRQKEKGLLNIDSCLKITDRIRLFSSDVSLLRADGIINRAHKELQGCFVPNCPCIDNTLQFYAGIRLRLKGADIIRKQNRLADEGEIYITPGYNLKCRYVLHAVFPSFSSPVKPEEKKAYQALLEKLIHKAGELKLKSLVLPLFDYEDMNFPTEEAYQLTLAFLKSFNDPNLPIIVLAFKDKKEAEGLIKKGANTK